MKESIQDIKAGILDQNITILQLPFFKLLSNEKKETIKQKSSPTISIILTSTNIFPLYSVGVISVIIVTDKGDINPITTPNSILMIANSMKLLTIKDKNPNMNVKKQV